MTLREKTRTAVAPDVHCRRFHDELVLLDLRGGEYFALDPLGARVWEELSQGLSIKEIVAKLVLEYEVGAERLESDLRALVAELVARGLLVELGDGS
jgi:hypothetical protein